MVSSAPPPGVPGPGERIGRFRILEQLGQGGMGVVFRAMEENLGREVALKVILPLYAHDPEFRERFTREARSQASLDSAHVVSVYAHGEEDGHLYIASQLVRDGDLGGMIRSAGVPPMVNALEVVEQVAAGLADAHDAGLVHRDIKPGNVLVRIRGGQIRAYLCDFGIARHMNADATRFSSSAVGTTAYMAPELHGGAKANAASDIYALGCLLWVSLTGTMPYQARTEYQMIGAHVNQPVPQLPGAAPAVHATNRILRTAMAKEPGQRYRSASAMRADLQAALRLPTRVAAAPAPRSGPTVLRAAPSGGDQSVPPEAGRGGQPGRSGGNERPTAPPRPPTWRPSSSPAPGSSSQPTASPLSSPSSPSSPPAPPTPPSPRGGSGASHARWWAVGGVAAAAALGVGVLAAVLTDGGSDPSPSAASSASASAETSEQAAEFAAADPKEIVQAAAKEMAVLEVARVQGEFQADDTGPVGVDLLATSIGDCEGTMTTEAGATAEFRSVDGQVYLRPDAAYWEEVVGPDVGTVVDVIGDRWVQDNSLRRSLRQVCDLDRFFERDGREDAVAVTDGTEEVAGEEAVKVTQSEGTQSETLYVRVAEPHYLLRLEESRADVFDFSEFDTEADIAAPPPGQIFDLEEYVAGNGG